MKGDFHVWFRENVRVIINSARDINYACRAVFVQGEVR